MPAVGGSTLVAVFNALLGKGGGPTFWEEEAMALGPIWDAVSMRAPFLSTVGSLMTLEFAGKTWVENFGSFTSDSSLSMVMRR